MKPCSFDYVKVNSLNELLQLLGTSTNAKVLAGGQSLVPMMNMRLAQPEMLIDINGLSELDYIVKEGNQVKVGALTRYCKLEKSEIINQYLPVLKEAIGYVAHCAIRNRGTIGGSLVHNDPTAEVGVALTCLGAEVVLLNDAGKERIIPLENFFITTYLTDIAANEILKEVRIAIPGGKSGFSFQELSKRFGDFAMVNAASVVQTDNSGQVISASCSFGGVGETPGRVNVDGVIMSKMNEEILDQVVAQVLGEIDPQSDNVASGEYKKDVAGVLMKKCLLEAYERSIAL
jgi:2-furoyl-CoA dehydrogenase FAD binding subunit